MSAYGRVQDAKRELADAESALWALRTRYYVQRHGSAPIDADAVVPKLIEIELPKEHYTDSATGHDRAQALVNYHGLPEAAIIVAIVPPDPTAERGVPAREGGVYLWEVQGDKPVAYNGPVADVAA